MNDYKKNLVLRTKQICFGPSRNSQASKERRLDDRIQISLSPRLHLSSSMRAAYHFQLVFNLPSLLRTLSQAEFSFQGLQSIYCTFPIPVSFPAHLILLIDYRKGISWKASKLYGAHIFFVLISILLSLHVRDLTKHQVIETYWEGNTLIFFTVTVRCLVASLTHRPLLILNPSVTSNRSVGGR
jgi:hypothetical protein